MIVMLATSRLQRMMQKEEKYLKNTNHFLLLNLKQKH